jgi:hypothetical protein
MSYRPDNPAPEPNSTNKTFPYAVDSPSNSLTPSDDGTPTDEKGDINDDKLLGTAGYSTASDSSERLPLASIGVRPSGTALGDWLVVKLGIRKVSREPELDSVSNRFR